MSNHCHHCNQLLRPDAQFCPSCGGAVAQQAAPTPGSAPEATAYVPQAEYGSAPVYPGGPPAAGPPPGQPPYFGPGQPPATPEFVPAESAGSGRGLGKLIGVGLAVVGLGAVGFLALRFITGGDKVAGGASSPEAVVEEMVAAINDKDPLAAAALLAPDEVDGLDELIEETTANFDDLGVDSLLGTENEDFVIDLTADNIDTSMEGDDAAIVSFELSGDVEVPESDAGVLTSLGLSDGSFDSSDLADALPDGGDEVEMIVIQLDGKWFASPMLTAGHYIVENTGAPGGEYDLVGTSEREDGADNAEDAVQALVDVINDPDADQLAAVLGGGEGRAALVFRDAISEAWSDVDTSSYEVSLSTSDFENGRIELSDVELVFDDYDGETKVSIDDDCLNVSRYDGSDTNETCLSDQLGSNDVDTTLWLDTVQEDGSQRIRIVPTLTDVLGRLSGLVDDRQTLLYRLEAAQYDEASTVAPGNDVEIEFDGQLYAVNEFPIEEGEYYNVTASDLAYFDLYTQYEGESLDYEYGGFTAESDGIARVVTYSEFDSDCEGPYAGCLPSGDGSTTLLIRQGARQAVSFPTVVSGELGPGDVRVFELNITEAQTVMITIDGESVSWEFPDDFDIYVDTDTYAFEPGTYELIVYNYSGEDSTTYEIVPTPA
jgi:FlaG/FlaF family flagellin (archaellin)